VTQAGGRLLLGLGMAASARAHFAEWLASPRSGHCAILARELLTQPSGGRGESGGRAGLTIMKGILVNTNVYEADLDMTRVMVALPAGRVRRLLGSIFGNLQSLGMIDKPRRSIDREQQQYSPTYD